MPQSSPENRRPEPDAPQEHAPVGASVDIDERLARQIEDIPASEGADVLNELPTDEAAAVAEALDPNTAADILSEMEPDDAAHVIEGMQEPEASVVLSAMDPDDRVDILSHVEATKREALVSDMPEDDAADFRKLAAYPPDTAGGLMTTDVTALGEQMTVQQAIDELRRLRQRHEQMFYTYVVDSRRHLVGVLSMRDLILADPDRRCGDIMHTEVKALTASTDQEEVARLFQKLNFLAMPVIDDRGRLLGIVTVDDVVDVIEREATEDVQKLFGAGAEERLASPWHFSLKKRTGWLIVNLATAFLAGSVVAMFEPTIARVTVLAVYLPIVAGTGGNASAQALAVAVRGIAVGESARVPFKRVLRREAVVGVVNGLVIGTITAVLALLWHGHPMLGVVVGLAMMFNHTLACVTGVSIPFLMKRLGFDPAQSSTIFTTTVTDVAGFFGFLSLAFVFLKWLE